MRSLEPRAGDADVELVPATSRRRTFGAGRYYWHIYHGGKRAGQVCVVQATADCHASITVELNLKSRGRGIGTIAFRRAAELSGYSTVYASLRKGNTASRIALERAGYHPQEERAGAELCMVWRRGAKL